MNFSNITEAANYTSALWNDAGLNSTETTGLSLEAKIIASSVILFSGIAGVATYIFISARDRRRKYYDELMADDRSGL